MIETSYWKFGSKYAGVTKRGKRFVVDSLSAARSRVSSTQKRSKKKMPKRTRRRRSTPKRSYRSRARGFLGGLGKGLSIKGTAVGTAGLIVMQRYQPFGGVYKPALDKIILGTVLPMAKMGNRDMFTVGVKEGLATLVNSYLGGQMGITENSGGML